MRRVLRRREIIADDFRHFEGDPEAPPEARGLIIALAQLRAHPQRWSGYAEPLGVRIGPADKVEELASELQRFALIAVEFPSPGEGRGYTQGRLLRARFGFSGELRALGPAVKRDLIFALARCGFDTFEVAAGEDLEACARALDRYSVAYQAAGAPEWAAVRQR
ncbi:MAG TPA: DUF934 domain-containing protein [Steroidobacteraceae bacterium]|jgi:uncharacterized protein (DUF934 family)|nr:DUF934 domain-containing protein [Steroidobacteraceae bacterium]